METTDQTMDAVNNPRKQGRPFPPGVSGNARGRPKGARNRRTRALIEAAEAGGETPLQYMLRVLRDPNAADKRRDAMATAAAPYVHPKLNPVDAKPSDVSETPGALSIEVSFVRPRPCSDQNDEGAFNERSI
jgi:hypothetical protein